MSRDIRSEDYISSMSKKLFNFILKLNNKRRIGYLSLTLLKNLFYDLNQAKEIPRDILIKPNYFNSRELYLKFKERCKKHRLFKYKESEDNIFFNETIKLRILNEIEDFNNKKEYIENPELFQQLSNSDVEIKNLLTIEYFADKHHLNIQDLKDYSKITDEDHEKYQYIIPSHNLNIENIYTLFNKEFSNIKFALNPNIEEEETFDLEKINIVRKLRVKVLREIKKTRDIFGINFISRYNIMCPRCNTQFTVLPHEVHMNINHLCMGTYMPPTISIKKSGLRPDVVKNLRLYECNIAPKEGNVDKKETFFIYSTEELRPGNYIMDIFTTKTTLSIFDKDSINLVLLLGCKKDMSTKSTNIINFNTKNSYLLSKQLGVKHLKIIDLLQSIREMISQYTPEHQIDNRGTLLQLFTLISGLGRLLFNYTKIGVQVMGDKSLGKTYVSGMIAMVLDINYYMVENSENISVPGFQGGINNKMVINGKTQSLFEPGIVTRYGLTVLDEAERMFSDKQLNLALKNFPNRSLNIEKIGGETDVPQNYTPIMCSNFYDSYHNQQYMTMVKEVYFTFARKDLTNTFHENNRLAMNKYIDKVNLYLTLDATQKKYQNDNLTKALYYTRLKMETANIDWRTGGRMESSYRFLFDVVCQIKIEKAVKRGERKSKATTTTLPEQHIYPYEEFQEELRNKLIGDRYYNLYDKHEMNQEQIDQITQLENSISKFILGKGIVIHEHLAGNSVEIDPKLNAVLYNVIIIIQLIENINSTTLSENVKDFVSKLILKCKRGLTQDEYNFCSHEYIGDQIKFDYDELDLDVEKRKEELDDQKIMKALKNHEEKKQKEEEEQVEYMNEIVWEGNEVE